MNEDARLVPVPHRLRRNPIDSRGLPVPYTTMVDPVTMQPDFRVLDFRRQAQCIVDKLCGLCGQPLGRYVAFIGGPKSGISRQFNDPGMHRECAIYASKVCPFISRETAQYRDLTPEQETMMEEHGIKTIHDERITVDRYEPEMFIYVATSYRPIRAGLGVLSQAGEFVETIAVEQRRPAWGR